MLCWWGVFFNALPNKCLSVLALMRGIGVVLLGGRKNLPFEIKNE